MTLHLQNVLRLEHFGAVHYTRASAGFDVFDHAWTSLLYDARAGAGGVHVMDAWRENPRGIDLDALIVEVARLRDRGVLDDDHRMTARVVDDAQAASLSAPLVTNVQITRACNLHCDHCFVDVEAQRHPDELSVEQLDALFAELSAAGAPLLLLAGGEPMMRRDFWQIVASCGAHDIDAALCTNATLIDDDKATRLVASPLRWFSISLDGADAAIHDRLRGEGAFDKAVRGIRALVRAGGVERIKLRVTVTSENCDHLVPFARTVAELGVNEVVFKPFRHTTGGEAFSSTHLYITRARYLAAVETARVAWPSDGPRATFDDGMPESLPEWTNVTPAFGCVGGTTHASVIYDGRIVACDAVHDAKDWTFHTHSLLDAWRNAPTIRAWRHLDDSGECSSCSNFTPCGGGCRARALAAGRSMAEPDPWAHCEDKPRDPARMTKVKPSLLRVLP